MTGEDRITSEFLALGALLARDGRFVLLSDLLGAGGALFRTAWHLREGEGGARRWSVRSADVCPGDPLGRAAEAYGYRLVRGEGGGMEGAALECVEPMQGLGHRVRRFAESIRAGLDLTRPGEHREGAVFAVGTAAYRTLAVDLAAPPGSFLPETPEEAARLSPEVERLGLPPDSWPALSLGLSLRRAFVVFARARRDLAVWIDRTSNFLDSSTAVPHFLKERELLLRGAGRLLPPGEELLSLAESVKSDSVLRGAGRDVRAAAASHERGIAALRSVFGR
ncbi:MAG: hypothetical protein ABIK65_02735 [Candidatus Eisenbacteria bacterium]